MGTVKLVSVTQPLVKTEDNSRNLTAEEFIVYCARVSNPSNQLNVDTAPKLIKYCMSHGHYSIFEQVNFSIEIKTSRAIAAQIIRHRSFSFQEFSQRYAEVQSVEPVELRSQGKTNRQVGDEIVDPVLFQLPHSLEDWFASEAIQEHMEATEELYQDLINAGVARECARMILPMASTSTLYMNGTLRSWIHYIELRTKQDTQKEHREVAEQIKRFFIQEFPIVSEALGWELST